MIQPKAITTEEFRYERKFLIADISAEQAVYYIKLCDSFFTEIYHERRINNVYFDSLGFHSYYENMEGDINRVKARIRWYGDLFSEMQKPVLEFKVKRGMLGKKNLFPFQPFRLSKTNFKDEINNALKLSCLPGDINNLMKSLNPVLLNSYVRKYFISKDKLVRLTLDKEITSYAISKNTNLFLNKFEEKFSVVIELKYDPKDEDMAKRIGNSFPFTLTKNSKYLNGLEQIIF